MNSKYRKSFERDLAAIRDRALLQRIRVAIDSVHSANQLTEIPKLKKLQTSDTYWRIKIGHYRIGIAIENETVEFIRCMNRKDFYRSFPA